ncbi:MAG: nitrilase-related carbon-nitrogen hydrolase [Bacteroidota bacterium]|nr:nitrilase-related carbon-nitrogen hydrolase [Bacteroidota bacterium]MDP4233515.1 nitrilase-related carbon-nitrogen hydrolase [Bacteroidota bacterium]MDP4243392.1 nitrilase-related carbon-nitrogen hydrolase [Bacteroidota bacterium]MDP4287921.1 nitrilase-related carbon-nitrogen hydrolase [Bacteroidota bacterium]
MRIACCQFAPQYRQIGRNLDTIREMVRNTDADLCIFPELATTGYFFRESAEIESLAEPVDGSSIGTLQAVAREENKAIITGFLEAANAVYYNSAVAIDAEGNLCGHYRKIHLFYYETRIFKRGDLGFPVFDLRTRSGNARVGIMICYDWRFPEAARELAVQGAELIAVPSNIVTTTGMLHVTLQTRAFENKVILAFADRVGFELGGEETLTYRGESAIINYSGEILSQASAVLDETIIAEVSLDPTRNKRINQFNDIMSDRMVSLYPSLATHRPSPAKISG